MLSSIIKSCSISGTLDNITPFSVKKSSKNLFPKVHFLTDLISCLKLSDFGPISSDRSQYSVLPDSLYSLEFNHPFLGLNQKTLFNNHHKNETKTIPLQGQDVSRMLTVYEDPNKKFVLQVFMLPQGFVMPLHDHPEMIVISKILHGSMEMVTYTKSKQIDHDFLLRYGTPVIPTSKVILKENQNDEFNNSNSKNYEIIFPDVGNFHSIRALENTLFFDVLAPPYSDKNDCTYYTLKRISDQGKLIGIETEKNSVHSLFPEDFKNLKDKFFVSPFDPKYFCCLPAPWTGGKIT